MMMEINIIFSGTRIYENPKHTNIVLGASSALSSVIYLPLYLYLFLILSGFFFYPLPTSHLPPCSLIPPPLSSLFIMHTKKNEVSRFIYFITFQIKHQTKLYCISFVILKHLFYYFARCRSASYIIFIAG